MYQVQWKTGCLNYRPLNQLFVTKEAAQAAIKALEMRCISPISTQIVELNDIQYNEVMKDKQKPIIIK